MTYALASFITIRQSDYSTVVAKYQNYWSNQIVDQHVFYPFNVGSIASNTTGGQTELTIDFAPSNSVFNLVENGIALNYFIEADLYYFTPAPDNAPPEIKNLFSSYIGEFIKADQTQTQISITIGSSINAVDAQAPPRKFTTTLIGEPPKL